MEIKSSKDSLADQMLALNEVLLRERMKGLHDANPRLRRKAARGLSDLGKVAERAIPLLEALLVDPDRRVREAAGQTLKRINSES
jgi:HEAT repeat protein